MPTYRLPAKPEPPVRERQAITVESAVASSSALRAAGVVLETRDYAPVAPEGMIVRLANGDRVTLVGAAVGVDGVYEAKREATELGAGDLVYLADDRDPDGALVDVVPHAETIAYGDDNNETDPAAVDAGIFDEGAVAPDEAALVEDPHYDPVEGVVVDDAAVVDGGGYVEPVYDAGGGELYGPPDPYGGDYYNGEPAPAPVEPVYDAGGGELYGPPDPNGGDYYNGA